MRGGSPPPALTKDELEKSRVAALAEFRKQRLDEPRESYQNHYVEFHRVVDTLLTATEDLHLFREKASEVLSDEKLFYAARYICAPPMSKDDLVALAEVSSVAPSKLRVDSETAGRIAEMLTSVLDRNRFPWVQHGRGPSVAERVAAVVSTASMIATRRLQMERRMSSSQEQESAVKNVLLGAGLTLVARRKIDHIGDAPQPGEFCPESQLGPHRADFIIGLWDRRVMAVECKVSNSYTNSIKRLNKEAAVKATDWRAHFGSNHMVPAAVLSGLYKLNNLLDAQAAGLSLFWALDLAPLADWISSTRGN